MNTFLALNLIDLESGRISFEEYIGNMEKLAGTKLTYTAIDYYSLVTKKHLLYKAWGIIESFTPNYNNIDSFLMNFSGSFRAKNFTWYGYNAMMWSIEIRTSKGYWVFQPPCLRWGLKYFTLGMLMFSPNGTPQHPDAKIYWDFDSINY